MALRRSSEPAELPLTLDEIKARLRVGEAADDADLMSMQRAAVRLLDGPEGILNRALVSQGLVYTLDAFPARDCGFDLPLPPLIEVTQVAYIDLAGAVQTWGSANYRVLNAATPSAKGRIELAYNAAWPSTRAMAQAVTVSYLAGYGARNAVPETVRALVLALVKESYDFRDPVAPGEMKPTPALERLIHNARFQVLA